MFYDIITNEWFQLFVGGFAANGVFTQIVALTPTKKDDEALGIVGTLLSALTGTFGLTKK